MTSIMYKKLTYSEGNTDRTPDCSWTSTRIKELLIATVTYNRKLSKTSYNMNFKSLKNIFQ